MPPDLTVKQQRFVDEYLVDCNGARAAVAAGYGVAGSRVAAHRLLTRANVRAAIKARQGVDARRLEIGRQEAIEGLLEAVNQAKAMGDPMALVAAWREIGRMLGFYAPERRQVEVKADAGAEVDQRRLEAMTDAELEALVAGQS